MYIIILYYNNYYYNDYYSYDEEYTRGLLLNNMVT